MWSVAGQMESISMRVEVYVAQGSACLARSGPGFKLQYHKEKGKKKKAASQSAYSYTFSCVFKM